ncbi:tRNA (N6-threonylcarbamoyladenosine(37)-N6)-methyltransferase TrmO [Alteromonas lipotrueiana]|uniref:tRNA (N6-threonylcarbamoyladenosine(37)-N6)-methyltransferase TrmO n=1 Tax=Alteromonas lipotrueiana TaxID=2803815 RepID=UPI001C44B242|nr:tRNA (N6-threonylcarbamoyladenosine(37)-N6)-methyltransferase TrmO [Alteromonas lipotrueiana]
MSYESYALSPIGHIVSPFKQKFAIPRQPNLADAEGEIFFNDDIYDASAFRGIDGYSHLWLLFVFHETLERGWKPLVKAPRLGGNATLGVFASRSTHRPNGIGMSVVKNQGLVVRNNRPVLKVSGVDLVTHTPIVDIKPYLPYADSINQATDSLAQYHNIPMRTVEFTPPVTKQLTAPDSPYPQQLKELIKSVLSQDPRPAYRQQNDDDPKVYKVKLYNADVSWQVRGKRVIVCDLSLCNE